MELYKEIHLRQGSEKWLDWRKEHVTATDSAKIMGKNPWSSALDCYNEKVEGKTTFINAAMQRGMDLEPIARDLLIQTYGINLKPKVFESIESPFIGVSLDAISDDNKTLYEIKVVGENTMKRALKGEIDTMYIIQCHKHMLVMGLDYMHMFFYYTDFLTHLVKIERDEKLIKDIIKADTKFYNENLLPRIPPEKYGEEYERVYNENVNDLAISWLHISNKIKKLKKEEEQMKNTIFDLVGDGNFLFPEAKIRMNRIVKKGNVNWKVLQKEYKIEDEEVEKFRGEDIIYSTLSEVK